VFVSFFPAPKLFFLSAVLWTGIAMAIWFSGFSQWQTGLDILGSYVPAVVEGQRPPFLSAEKAWTYIYILVCGGLFVAAWFFLERNKWFIWSVAGTTLIMLSTYFNVQISVFLNDWYGDFYDLIQKALGEPGSVTAGEYFGKLATVAWILIPYIMVLVLLDFFVSHYVFRWRTAMNNYYMENWPKLRTVEGAAQRVQEDTMRFARIMSRASVSPSSDSIMTLIAFLPLLYGLSQQVTEMPFFGQVDGSLVYVALLSAAFGTVLLAVVGYKLPGLEFQQPEGRGRLPQGAGLWRGPCGTRAQPPHVRELFSAVRRNYYRLYFHYLYFGIARWSYLQASNFVPHPPGADHRDGQDHARHLAADPDRVRSGVEFVPVPDQLLDDDRRADFDLQAPARFRSRVPGPGTR
jgi:peptide/bleomycin uptake transporter